MFTRIFRVAIAALCAASFSAAATEVVERPELAEHFRSAGVSGTFVLLDIAADRVLVHNASRAQQCFEPASTFKIFNTLVGLETGAVKDELEVLPYGGKPQFLKQWEKDMHLRDAIRASNIPVYQELARRIGAERMQHYINLAGYGNRNIGSVIDRFWLDGPLEISAIEQAQLMGRLAQRKLPFSERSMGITRGLIQQDDAAPYTMFAKTGWSMDRTPQLGWLVGWIESEGKVYPFALNIDIQATEDAAKRKLLVQRSLQTLLFQTR